MEIKRIQDYYDEVHKRFPDLPREDLERILQFGWKSFYLHNSYGGDVLMHDKNVWCYSGFLTKNPIKHFRYYMKKLKLRLRVLFHRRGDNYDGYYYFALSQERQDKIDAQRKPRGRKKKWINYDNVLLYAIKDECKISQLGLIYIYRVPYPIYVGAKLYKEKFISDCAELVEVRPAPKFLDLLVTNYDYDLL